ncbi:uncharacterized protein K441DRAFT_661763 [Cenococcum geophilum 1.58]|uniref:uncharacterized protein n=1 Tax=Cenococcum geophilum 1.58 TaxID=794803 RepID=UPI00358E8C30|nr:hypothetical protein K441DRAFT_661763 [Cenococcum geophilum 1.58]
MLISRLWLNSILRLTVASVRSFETKASVQSFDQGSTYSSTSSSTSYNRLYIRAIN